MESKDYLIIGNGIAGLSAAKEIRKNDLDSSILILGDEEYHTYYRVRLTALLAEDYECDNVLVNKPEWYIENNIDVKLNTKAVNLNTENKIVELDNGDKVSYKKLLIATGSRAFVPPIKGNDKKGFYALRTLNDLTNIKEFLDCCNKVAVIGGGLLGLEAAWSLRELGKEVTVFDHSENVLSRQLDPELSKRLEKELYKLGIKVVLCADTKEILGEDRVSGVRLADGSEYEVDGVLASTGVRPILDLVTDSEIETDRGIVVDKCLKTNIDNVYAAGDVAEINGINLGLWTASMEQGRIAGANMSGDDKSYDIPKLFASLNIGPIRLFSAGDVCDYDETYKHIEGNNIAKIFVKDNIITGSILYGDTSKMSLMRKAVFAKISFEEFVKENNLEGLFI